MRIKGHAEDREKIFTVYMSDIRPGSRVYKESSYNLIIQTPQPQNGQKTLDNFQSKIYNGPYADETVLNYHQSSRKPQLPPQ